MTTYNTLAPRPEITLPPQPTSTTLTAERSLPLLLRVPEAPKADEAVAPEAEQAARPTLLHRTIGRIAGRTTTQAPIVEAEPIETTAPSLLPLIFRLTDETKAPKALPLTLKPRTEATPSTAKTTKAPEEPIVVAAAPVAPKKSKAKAKVTVVKSTSGAKSPTGQPVIQTKARPTAAVPNPNRSETVRPRERLNLVSTALLAGGLALVGAKAYRAQTADKVRGYRPTTTLAAARAKAARLKTVNLRDAPLMAVTRTKTRMTELTEKGHDNRRVLAKAIGAVVVVGLAYAAYRGLHHSADPTTLAGSDHATGTILPPKAPSNAHSVLPVAPPKHVPQTTGSGDLFLPGQHEATAVHGDVVTIHNGDGVTNLIDNFAKQNHVQLTGNQNYRLYEQLQSHFGNNMLNADTYNMPNGDLGLRHAGNATWNPNAQAFMEDFFKTAAKKKTLS